MDRIKMEPRPISMNTDNWYSWGIMRDKIVNLYSLLQIMKRLEIDLILAGFLKKITV
jgi:hypothetical protein